MNERIARITHKMWNFEVRVLYDDTIALPPYPLSSQLIAKNLRVQEGEDVLDLGTGCGIQAIVAKKLGASDVLATDVTNEILDYARANFLLNGVHCDTCVSDLFSDVPKHGFGVIVANPPMFASADPSNLGVYGGPDGRTILDRIIREAPSFLILGGRLIIPTESYLGFGITEHNLTCAGFRFQRIARGISPCSLHMLENLNFCAIKGQLHEIDGIRYFSSRVYEATRK